MTKKQRERVVELLRCAADECARGRRAWLDTVAMVIDADESTTEAARSAGMAVCLSEPFLSEMRCHSGDVMPPEFNLRASLEAAARVEEGSWP